MLCPASTFLTRNWLGAATTAPSLFLWASFGERRARFPDRNSVFCRQLVGAFYVYLGDDVIRKPLFTWPQEAADLIAEHYKLGITASQSARILNDKFGSHLTRNAIIGKRDRIGLSRKSNGGFNRPVVTAKAKAEIDATRRLKRIERIAQLEMSEKSKKRKNEIDALKRAEAYALAAEKISPHRTCAKSTADAILALKSNSCRYPIGAVGADDFHFCCEPRDEVSSYCAKHRAICTVVLPAIQIRRAA